MKDCESPSSTLATRHLFDLQLSVPVLHDVGGPAGEGLRVGAIAAGAFAGPRVSGSVRSGSADWQTIGADGAVAIDARLVLETSAGELIGMSYRGLRHGPAEVMERLASGEDVDPDLYYFRILCSFTTSAPRLYWLNRTLAAGSGRRRPDGPVYAIFELL